MSKIKNDGKFIITDDAESAIIFTRNGLKLISQDGESWLFMRDDELMEMNKQLFSKKKVKYTFTNKLLLSNTDCAI